MQLDRLRRLTVERSAAEGPRYIAAASGLAVHHGQMFIVGDDETHLAVFDESSAEPGKLMRLFPEARLADPVKRKAAKPDLETLLVFPAVGEFPFGGLLALGSGSSAKRRRAVILPFDSHGRLAKARILSVDGLFAAVGMVVPEVNIEGAVIRNGELILFNRGNRNYPETILITFRADDFRSANPRPIWSKTARLPDIGGIPLTVTDACLLEGGSILASTVAEDTGNAYDDGGLLGAAFVLFNSDLSVDRVDMIEPPVKIEGVHARRNGTQIEILAVSDADDPAKAAGLYRCTI